jgi:hypothetical protein
MQRRKPLKATAGALLLAGALLAPGWIAPAPAGAAVVDVTDATGDTLTDTIEDPIVAPMADIVATSADSRPEGVTLAFRVAQMADPMADRNWLSAFTSATWELDTSGDGKRDYIVDYYRDEETGVLTADLDKAGAGRPADECTAAKPGYSPEAGYTVTVDPKCLGGANAFTYRMSLEYTLDAEDPSADVATDSIPDEGWSSSVAVTLPAGEAPLAIVPPTPSAPPSSAPGASPSGSPAGPEATTSTMVKPIAPQGDRPRSRPTSGASRDAAEASAPAPGASAPAPDLARTGLGDRALRMAWFAVGLGLMGIGLSFANRRPAAKLAEIGRQRLSR